MILVGREAGVERLSTLVMVPGVTTLVAPHGFGAAALADAALERIGRDTALVRTCDLAHVTDDVLVATVVADQIAAVRSPEASSDDRTDDPTDDRDVDSIISLFSARRAALLLRDVGQVVVGTARLVATLKSHCPELSILVTSATPLQIEGERTIELPPIRIDGDVLTAVRQQAEGLRAAAAAAADGGGGGAGDGDDGGVGGAGDLSVSVELCELVGAAPLAMALLAGQLANHTPLEISNGVSGAFDAVHGTSPASDVAVHSERLARMVRWSYQQLDADHQRLFDRLAVFQSGCAVSGALAIMVESPPNVDREQALEPLTRVGVADRHVDEVTAMLEVLERAAMLRTSSGVAGLRWVMPEAVRHHGLGQLRQRNERSSVRNLHVAHVVAEAGVSASVCRGRDWAAGVERFAVLSDDIRLAVEWAIDAHRSVELDEFFGHLTMVSRWSGWSEPFEWSKRAGERSPATGLQLGPATLVHIATGALSHGDFAAALRWAGSAVNAAVSSRDRSRARHVAAISLVSLGRHAEATAMVDSLLSEPADDPVDAAMQLSRAAVIHFALGRLDDRDAQQMAARAAAFAQSSDSPLAMSVVALDSAELDLIAGRVDAARLHFKQAIETARRIEAKPVVERALAMQLAQPGGVGLAAAASVLREWVDRPEPQHEFVVLESVAINLIESGRIDTGATLLGHLDHDPRCSMAMAARRNRATADLDRYKRGPERRKHGAEMTRAEALGQARRAVEAATK